MFLLHAYVEKHNISLHKQRHSKGPETPFLEMSLTPFKDYIPEHIFGKDLIWTEIWRVQCSLSSFPLSSVVPLSWGSTKNNALPCCSFLSFSSFQGVFVVNLQTPKSSTTQKSDDKMGTTCCQPLLLRFPENLKGCACVFPMAGIYKRPLYPQNLMAEVAEGRKKKWGFSKLQDRASGLSCEIVGPLLLAEKLYIFGLHVHNSIAKGREHFLPYLKKCFIAPSEQHTKPWIRWLTMIG